MKIIFQTFTALACLLTVGLGTAYATNINGLRLSTNVEDVRTLTASNAWRQAQNTLGIFHHTGLGPSVYPSANARLIQRHIDSVNRIRGLNSLERGIRDKVVRDLKKLKAGKLRQKKASGTPLYVNAASYGVCGRTCARKKNKR